MPNNAGITATKTPAKRAAKSAPETSAGSAESPPVSERKLRTPLERAEANVAKANASVAKLEEKKKKLTDAVAVIDVDLQLARDEAAYAASHPLIRQKRREAGEEVPPLVPVGTAPVTVVPSPAPAPDAESAPAFSDGSEIKSTVPPGIGEDDDDADTDENFVGAPVGGSEDEADTSAVPGFDFQAALAQSQAEGGPQTYRV